MATVFKSIHNCETNSFISEENSESVSLFVVVLFSRETEMLLATRNPLILHR